MFSVNDNLNWQDSSGVSHLDKGYM